jgi:hypothetical protein
VLDDKTGFAISAPFPHLEGGAQQVDNKEVHPLAFPQVLRGLLEEALLHKRGRSAERRAQQVQAREEEGRAVANGARARMGTAQRQTRGRSQRRKSLSRRRALVPPSVLEWNGQYCLRSVAYARKGEHRVFEQPLKQQTKPKACC